MGFTLNMADVGILGITGATVYNYPNAALGDTLRLDSINILGTSTAPYTLAIPSAQLDGGAIAPGTGIIVKRVGETAVRLTGLIDGITYTPAAPLSLEEVGDGFNLSYSNDTVGWVSVSASGEGGLAELEQIEDVNYGGRTRTNGDALLYNPNDNQWQLGSSIGYDTMARFPEPPEFDSVETTFATGGLNATVVATVTDPDRPAGAAGDLTFFWNRQGSTTQIDSTDTQTATGATTAIPLAGTAANGVYEVRATDSQGLVAMETVSITLLGTGPEGTLSVDDPTPVEGEMVNLSYSFADQTGTVTRVSLAPIDADGMIVGNFVFNQPLATVPASPMAATVPLLATGVTTAYRLEITDSDGLVTHVDVPVAVESAVTEPTIVLGAFSAVGQNTATVVATVLDDGGAPVRSILLDRQNGTAPDFTDATNLTTGQSTTFNLTGLTANTAYTYAARGTNSAGQGALSNAQSFTTTQPNILDAITWNTPGLARQGPWHTATGRANSFFAFSGQSYNSPNNIDFVNTSGQTITFTPFGQQSGITVTTMALRFWLGRGDTQNFDDSTVTFPNGYDNDEGGFQLAYSSPATAGPTGGPGARDIGFTMSAPGFAPANIVISRMTLS